MILFAGFVVSCSDLVEPIEFNTHPAGWAEDHSDNFHGTFVLESPGKTESCATCHAEVAAQHGESAHGAPPSGWAGGGFEGSAQCIACHTTAPGWKTGYRGPADTSTLRTIDCEACHGPGSDHAAEAGPGYGAVAWEVCTSCHTPERSPGFDAARTWGDVGHGPR